MSLESPNKENFSPERPKVQLLSSDMLISTPLSWHSTMKFHPGSPLSPERQLASSQPLSSLSAMRIRDDSSQEPQKTRLCISKLVLENFKSYAGRQVIGPFHPSFSSIVGPNGSGKSNVIDSLLFVFGFRASKMRQNKLSALIHSSSDLNSLTSCSVEIHFCKVYCNNSSELVPESEFMISRKAFKNSSSKYYFNGKESTYSEIQAFLSAEGIDLNHKRFLILQGEVESIALMKPKATNENDDGLLEYLEDIIGTAAYKKPIQDLAVQLEDLEQSCSDKSERLKIVQKEKDNLYDIKNQAIEYIQLQNDLVWKKACLIDYSINKIKRDIDTENQNLDSLNTQYKTEESLYHKIKDELKLDEGAIYEKQVALNKKKAIEADMREKCSSLEKEAVQSKERKHNLVLKHKKFSKLLETSEKKLTEIFAALEKTPGERAQIEAQIKNLREVLKTEQKLLQTMTNALGSKTQKYSNEIERKKELLRPFSQKMEGFDIEISRLRAEATIIEKKKSKHENELLELGNLLAKLESQLEAKLEQYERLKNERMSSSANLKSLQDQIRQVTLDQSKAKSAYNDISARAQEAFLKQADRRNQNSVLSSLNSYKKLGHISGFYGRLGDLGQIDEKYDVAITTACMALNNMVVDSIETGQQCIEYLRKNNLGRAVFTVLNKLPKYNLDKIDIPKGSLRLFDLIQVQNDSFKPAFFSAVQNALVASSLEDARRIAYGSNQRWRVVTLKGELIDKSGTLSGGGHVVSQGGMKLLGKQTLGNTSNGDLPLEELEKIKLEAQKAVEQLDLQLRELKNKEEYYLQQLPALKIEYEKTELDLHALKTSKEDLQSQYETLNSKVPISETDLTHISQLNSKIAKLQAENELVKKSASAIEIEIEKLQNIILDMGGSDLKVQKNKVEDLEKAIDDSAERIKSLEYTNAMNEKEKVKLLENKKNYQKELEGVEECMLEYEEGNTVDLKQLECLKDEIAAFQSDLNELQKELNRDQKEMDSKLESLNKFEKIAAELKLKKSDIEKAIDGLNHKAKGLNQQRSKLRPIEDSYLDLIEGETTSMSCEATSFLPNLSPEELDNLDPVEIQNSLNSIEQSLSNMKVDLSVLKEYRQRLNDFRARSNDLDLANNEWRQCKSVHSELCKKRYQEFMDGFMKISAYLKEMYQLITMGGNAELELVDSLDPFSEGVVFSVMPPKKSWKNISNLSGGEKTLSSLALVFALHQYKPTPLYFMDEIDAALDFRNVSIVANYINERTKNAQFIVISLRNNMFELAARLIGVYKTHDKTKSIALNNIDCNTSIVK